MNYLLQGFSQTVGTIFGSPDTHEENSPGLDGYCQSGSDDYEFEYSDEKASLINHGTLKDLEEGRLTSGGQCETDSEVKLDSKHYAYYLLTTACGFMSSVFSFIDGMIFAIQCPENWILPCLLMLMGALGTIALLYVFLKLLERDFHGFRRHEQVIMNTSFVILILQWSIDVFILYLKDKIYVYSSHAYCSSKFYGYTAITNAIAILGFLVSYILRYIHQKRTA